MPQSRSDRGRYILLLPICFGLGLVSLQSVEYWKARSSKEWPSVPGVLKSTGDAYRVHLSYSYTVGSNDYFSDRIIFGHLGNRTVGTDSARIQALGDGREVVVYYKPGDPAESTLVVGRVHENSLSNMLFGSGFILMGTLGLILIRFRRRMALETATR